MTAQVLGSLPPSRDTWNEFLSIGFGLSQPQPLQALGRNPADKEVSQCLPLSFFLSAYLSPSHLPVSQSVSKYLK